MSNSRPLTNSKVSQAYHDNEIVCEIAFELGLCWDWSWMQRRHVLHQLPPLTVRINREAVHHIWSLGRRPDIKSNLIAIAEYPHWVFHFGAKGGQDELRMLCLLSKFRKSRRLNDPSEFNLDDLYVAAGKHIAGFVQYCKIGPGWEFCEKYRLELLEMIDG